MWSSLVILQSNSRHLLLLTRVCCNSVGGHPCNEKSCPPCTKTCPNLCVHGRCDHKCSEPCPPCREPCQYECPHQGRCKSFCHQTCTRQPCQLPCTKTIAKCGHPCIGLCGEVCPTICRDPKCKSSKVMVLDSSVTWTSLKDCDPEDRFLVLDCGHFVESSAMDQYISSQMKDRAENGSIKLIKCPTGQCRQFVYRSLRYSNAINKVMASVEAVKGRIRRPLSDDEKKSIRSAMGERYGSASGKAAFVLCSFLFTNVVTAGSICLAHWFQCPNGHVYYIGECGGAMTVGCLCRGIESMIS
jgi:hypothetical protein